MPLLLLAYLGFISLGLPDGMLGVGWPHLRAELGEPVGAVGFVLFTATAGYLLSSVTAGFMLERLGVGWLLAGSTGLVAVALAGFGAAPALVAVVAAGLVLGLGSGAIDAGLNAYAARHFGARHMNWLHASFGFGATLGPLVITAALALGVGWRWGYGTVALAQALLATAFALTARAWRNGPAASARPDQVRPAASSSAGSEAAPALPLPGPPPTFPDQTVPPLAVSVPPAPVGVARTLTLPAVWRSVAAFVAYAGVELGAGLWAYTLLTEGRGVSDQLAGLAVATYWGSLFVGRLVVGVVAERVGTHRVLTGSMVGIAAGAALVSVPAPGWLAVAGLMLVGFAAAPVFPLLTLTTAERVGERHADRTVGLQVGAGMLGGTALPAGIGLLIGWLGPEVLGPAVLASSLALAALYRSRFR